MRWLLVALAILAAAADSAGAAAVPTGALEYRLSWNGIPAASAVIDVTRDDATTYRIEAATRTNSFVDLFWRLRGRVESRFAADTFAPLGFRFDREINRKPEVTEVTFGGEAPFAVGLHRRDGREHVKTVDEDYVLDPVTAIFRALQEELEAGATRVYEVFTGQSTYRVELRGGGEETVRTAAGTFAALRVEPRVWKVGEGLEPRLRGATIWVSQAAPRMPVRIRSEVFVGAVHADLQRVVGLEP